MTINGFVYLIRWNGLVKIGVSINPDKRLRQIRWKHSGATIEHVIRSRNADSLERVLHSKYADRRNHGEWYRLTQKQIDEVISISECHRLGDCPEWLRAHWLNPKPPQRVRLPPSPETIAKAKETRRIRRMEKYL